MNIQFEEEFRFPFHKAINLSKLVFPFYSRPAKICCFYVNFCKGSTKNNVAGFSKSHTKSFL